MAEGHTLASGTDTEVMAHLIEEQLRQAACRWPRRPARVLRRLRGAFSIAVISADEPDTIVGRPPARRRSSSGCTTAPAFLASDIPALIGHTARASSRWPTTSWPCSRPGTLAVTTLDGGRSSPSSARITWDLEAAQKGGYEDFMSKEIHEQPEAVADTLLERRAPGGEPSTSTSCAIADDALRAIDKVFIVACGSSYHAALVAKYAIEHWVRLPVEVDIASEFRYRDPVRQRAHALRRACRQSGETLDTSEAMREAARRGAKVLVVSTWSTRRWPAPPTACSTPGPGPRSAWRRRSATWRRSWRSRCSACTWPRSKERCRRRRSNAILNAMETLPGLVSRGAGAGRATSTTWPAS